MLLSAFNVVSCVFDDGVEDLCVVKFLDEFV